MTVGYQLKDKAVQCMMWHFACIKQTYATSIHTSVKSEEHLGRKYFFSIYCTTAKLKDDLGVETIAQMMDESFSVITDPPTTGSLVHCCCYSA